MPKKAASQAVAVRPADPAIATAYYTRSALAQAVNQVEKDLGGRSVLLQTLLQLPLDAALEPLVALLTEPRSDSLTLAEVLQRASVPLSTILGLITQAGFARAMQAAVQIIAAKAPAVVDDVMTRAAAHEIRCDRCDGLTTVAGPTPDAAPVPCPDCKGRGSRVVLPDLDRQKLALDLARLLPKKAMIEQHLHAPGLGTGSIADMTHLIRATDDLLAHARPAPRAPVAEVIDATPGDVVDSPAETPRA